MGFDLLAAVKIPVQTLRSQFAPTSAVPERAGWERGTGRDGASFQFRALGNDASLVHPDASSDSPPSAAYVLRALLSEVLDQHNDERGLFFLPAGEESHGDSYASLVSHTAGSWVGVPPRGLSFAAIAMELSAPPAAPDAPPITGNAFESAGLLLNDKMKTRGNHNALRDALGSAFGRTTPEDQLGTTEEPPPPEALGGHAPDGADALAKALGQRKAQGGLEALLKKGMAETTDDEKSDKK